MVSGGRKLGTRVPVGTKVKSTMTNGVMLDMEPRLEGMLKFMESKIEPTVHRNERIFRIVR